MTFITPQLLLNGVTGGLIIGVLAMGIVLIQRTTKVINFAVANMGLVGSGLLAVLVLKYHVPFLAALPVALAAGTVFGLLADRIVIRRLFYAPRVIVLVATIGIAQLAETIAALLPKISNTAATYPVISSGVWRLSATVQISGTQIAIAVVVPLIALALSLLLNRTVLGKAVLASADNPALARL